MFRLTYSRHQADYKNKEEIFTNSRVLVLELYRTKALPSRHNARKDSSQLAALVIAH
jgi:hypothetical protein